MEVPAVQATNTPQRKTTTMPKQFEKSTTAVHHESGDRPDWLQLQPSFSSPTEGASQDGEDSTISLKHNENLGLHKSGKSVAKNATSNAARPLESRDFGGPSFFDHSKSKPVGNQRDYDGAGPEKEPVLVKRAAKEKR
jgi:hypothetical protein